MPAEIRQVIPNLSKYVHQALATLKQLGSTKAASPPEPASTQPLRNGVASALAGAAVSSARCLAGRSAILVVQRCWAGSRIAAPEPTPFGRS